MAIPTVRNMVRHILDILLRTSLFSTALSKLNVISIMAKMHTGQSAAGPARKKTPTNTNSVTINVNQ
jgi:hypothetical protein